MRQKYIYIALVLVAVTSVIGYLVFSRASQHTINSDQTPAAIETIRSFMGDPNIELSFLSTQSPSNFSVGRNETLPGGDGRMIVPENWKRQVDVYEQTNLTKDCQIYTYEVDTQTHKVVQVQLAQNPPIGSDMEYEKSQCLKSSPSDAMVDTEVEKLAWSYARKNVPDLSQTKAEVSFEKGDRYIWMWQDSTYKLPNTLTSEPWPYPTIRVILDKQGRLITYLNTTFFFYTGSSVQNI